MIDMQLEDAVQAALLEVYDPEIPTLSVVDLGMVQRVTCADGWVQIQMTPTFMGCPALAFIKQNVEQRILQVPGVEQADVQFVYDEPWTTDKLSEAGKRKLKEFGIAPPTCSLLQMRTLKAECPYCGSQHTRMENLFGPTACRAVFYCEDCRQPFEAMKPV